MERLEPETWPESPEFEGEEGGLPYSDLPSSLKTSLVLPVHIQLERALHHLTFSNLQSLKLKKEFGNVKFAIHFKKLQTKKHAHSNIEEKSKEISTRSLNSEEEETHEIIKVFYGLKILFAAYSPVFDEMVYDDENEESFASDKKTEEIELGGLDDGEESIKTIHLYDIHPKAFENIYDILLGGLPKLIDPSHFTGSFNCFPPKPLACANAHAPASSQ